MFFCSKLYICLTQGIIFYVPAISSLSLPCFVITSQPQVKNLTNVYIECLHHSLMDLSGNMSFFQQVQKAMSVGCYCLILIHSVYFDYDCQLT